MKRIYYFALSLLLMAGCTSKQENMKKELTDFIRRHDSVMIPLYKQTALASWEAAISGKPEDFKKAQTQDEHCMELAKKIKTLKSN